MPAGARFEDGFNAGFNLPSDLHSASHSDPGTGPQLISDFEMSAPEAYGGESPVLAAAAVEEESEHYSPRTAVAPPKASSLKSDPMMSEPAAGSAGTSFSDLAEMPPLKEPPVYTPPASEPPVEQTRPTVQIYPKNAREEKPKIQPREVAQKAQEISTFPADDLIIFRRGDALFFGGGRRWIDGGSAPQKLKSQTERNFSDHAN